MSVTVSLLINIIGSGLQQILSRYKLDMLKNAYAIFRTCLQWWNVEFIFLNYEMKWLAYFHHFYLFLSFFSLPFLFISPSNVFVQTLSRVKQRKDKN